MGHLWMCPVCMDVQINLYHVHVCTYHVSWIMSSRNKAQPSVPADLALRTNEGLVPDRHTPTRTNLLPEKSCTVSEFVPWAYLGCCSLPAATSTLKGRALLDR